MVWWWDIVTTGKTWSFLRKAPRSWGNAKQQFQVIHAIQLTPFWNLHVCLCNRFVCGLVQLKHFVWLVSHKGPSAFWPIIAFVSSLAALGDSVVPVNKLKVTWTVGCTFQFICIISIYMDINLMNSTWINGYLYSFARGLCCGASSQLTAGKVWWLHVYMSRNHTSVWDFCVAWSLTMADRKVQTLSRSPTRLVETRYQDTHLFCRFWRKRKLQTKQSSTIMCATAIFELLVWDESSRNISAGIIFYFVGDRAWVDLPLILFKVIFFLSFFLISDHKSNASIYTPAHWIIGNYNELVQLAF